MVYTKCLKKIECVQLLAVLFILDIKGFLQDPTMSENDNVAFSVRDQIVLSGTGNQESNSTKLTVKFY